MASIKRVVCDHERLGNIVPGKSPLCLVVFAHRSGVNAQELASKTAIRCGFLDIWSGRPILRIKVAAVFVVNGLAVVIAPVP
jgi:hypothetical protein